MVTHPWKKCLVAAWGSAASSVMRTSASGIHKIRTGVCVCDKEAMSSVLALDPSVVIFQGSTVCVVRERDHCGALVLNIGCFGWL